MSDLQTYPAPAKLNLFLHVVGRRQDGYHLLQSVFRFLDYADSLSFRVRDDGVIKRDYALPGVPEEDDLCAQAAKLLQRTAGTRLGVEITLKKKLPLGGGLGSGSSDAATTLMALNRLWKLGFTREKLQHMGLQLGADVPVFVFGQSAFAEGVGEVLQPISLPPAWYVVLVPKVNVSTAEIFTDPELTRNTNRIKITAFSTGQVHNDLEPVVCRKYPQVAQHLAWLK
ncbi:MAG: 4-(cytidine 5'-diphospho)-2-C-methyl-D-erythritol kinase, partial [Burkholderiales bacterium]